MTFKGDALMTLPPPPSFPDIRSRFMLRPDIAFLNHGSFGAVLRETFDHQTEWRRKLEAEPIELIGRRWPELIAQAKAPIAEFLHMQPSDFGLVTNATEGVNAILQSLRFAPGDELLTTTHVYNAVRMSMRRVAEQSGATYREVDVATSLRSAGEITTAVMNAVTESTKLLVIDHVTSPTALVFPVEQIAARCAGRGVDVLIDGAHAPGMLDLNVPATGAAYYAGNLHKWCCAPKGSGFLWVRPDRQAGIHPCVVSHNFDKSLADEFEWQGTRDGSAWFTIPQTLKAMSEIGWERIRAYNRALTLWAHQMLADRWNVEPLSPLDGQLLGSMATLPLPGRLERIGEVEMKALQSALYHEDQIEAPLFMWQGACHLRVCGQMYNIQQDYARLADAIDRRL